MVMISGSIFIGRVIDGSFIGENIHQFIIAPTVTAISVIFIIGVVIFLSSSFSGRRGVDSVGDHTSMIIIRAEYDAVRIVASMNIVMIRVFVGLNRTISRIMSFE